MMNVGKTICLKGVLGLTLLCWIVICLGINANGETVKKNFDFTVPDDCVRFLAMDKADFITPADNVKELADLFYPVSAEFYIPRQISTANPTDYTIRFCHSYFTFLRLFMEYSNVPANLRTPLKISFRGRYEMLNLDKVLNRFGTKNVKNNAADLELKQARLLHAKILYRYAQLQELRKHYSRYIKHSKDVKALKWDSAQGTKFMNYLTKHLPDYASQKRHGSERDMGRPENFANMAERMDNHIKTDRRSEKNTEHFSPEVFLAALDSKVVDPYIIVPDGREPYQMGNLRNANTPRMILKHLSTVQKRHLGRLLHSLGSDILAVDYTGKENLRELVCKDILPDGGRVMLSNIIHEQALADPEIQKKIFLNNYLCYLIFDRDSYVYDQYIARGSAELIYSLILNDLPLKNLSSKAIESAMQHAKRENHTALSDALSIAAAHTPQEQLSANSLKMIKKMHSDLMKTYNDSDELVIVVDTMHNPKTTMYQFYDFFYRESHERRMSSYIRGNKTRWSMMITRVCSQSFWETKKKGNLPGNYYIYISGKCSENQEIPVAIFSHRLARQQILSLFDKDVRRFFDSQESIDKFTMASPAEKQRILRRKLLPELYQTARKTPLNEAVREIIYGKKYSSIDLR